MRKRERRQQKNCVSAIFFSRLKQAAGESRLNQLQLAELAGISQSSISRYLRGLMEPSASDAAKLAAALGHPLDWFFQDESGVGPAVEAEPGHLPASQRQPGGVSAAELAQLNADLKEAALELDAALQRLRAVAVKIETLITDRR